MNKYQHRKDQPPCKDESSRLPNRSGNLLGYRTDQETYILGT